jgi:hypothetical protein
MPENPSRRDGKQVALARGLAGAAGIALCDAPSPWKRGLLKDVHDFVLELRRHHASGVTRNGGRPEHAERAGTDLFRAVGDRDMEGIVAKLAVGRYPPEATTWVNVKNGAYRQVEGRAEFFDPAGAALHSNS